MDPAVVIIHALPDIWHLSEKPCKNGKVNLYDTALALECVQDFDAQGSILTLVIALCVSALVRIVQVISRSNIIINVGLLGGRVRGVITIFAILLLWQRKEARIVQIICIILDLQG